MNINQLSYLKAMGIQAWQRNQSVQSEASTSLVAAPSAEWQTLQQAVAACTSCQLHATRTQTVFGVGNPAAKLMVIGEAPGFNEDAEGEPFVGRAGQLLNAMLQAIGLQREEIYIANILKCRPPNNRDPQAEEVATCTPFLQKQIALIKPDLLVAVGRIAAHFLLETKTSLTQLRGKMYEYNQTPLIVTFHPAYLLRSPRDKAKAYEDLQMISRKLAPLSGEFNA